MSPPIRENFAHGQLFCFVLDVNNEDSWDTNHQSSSLRLQSRLGTPSVSEDTDEYKSNTQLLSLMYMSVRKDVFRRYDAEDDNNE